MIAARAGFAPGLSDAPPPGLVRMRAVALGLLLAMAVVFLVSRRLVPVHPAWVEDRVWFMTFGDSVKVRNLAANADVAMHWQVDESGDGVEVWGTAVVHDDLETRRRMWSGA